MPITALPTAPSRALRPADFANQADAFLAALPAFGTEATALESKVNAKEASAVAAAATAVTKAGEASTSAGLAQGYAATADTKAGEAAGSASAAAGSADFAEDKYLAMDKRYLGAKSSAPSVDNQGAALQSGAVYYDTTLGSIRTWNGSTWVIGISAVAGVSSFNGATGAVTGVSSFNGATGAVTGVSSFNGATGAVTFKAGISYTSRASNTALVAADSAGIFDLSGTWTQTFIDAATLGAGWFVYLRNVGTDEITLDPYSSQLIDGLTTGVLRPGMTILVTCTGSALQCLRVGPQVVTEALTSGTSWVCPLGVRSARIRMSGGGGGGQGGKTGGPGAGYGGRGGGYVEQTINLVPGSSYSYTIGAGGAGGGAAATGYAGSAGGATTWEAMTASGGHGGSVTGSSTASSGGAINLPDAYGHWTSSYATKSGANCLGTAGVAHIGSGSVTVDAAGYGAGGRGGLENEAGQAGRPGVIILEY